MVGQASKSRAQGGGAAAARWAAPPLTFCLPPSLSATSCGPRRYWGRVARDVPSSETVAFMQVGWVSL